MYKYLIIALLTFFSFSYSQKLKTCYMGYYLFLPLVENCIIYEKNKISAIAQSTKVGSIFKKVKYEGYSIYKNNFKPNFFYFLQKEGKLKMIHRYKFNSEIFFEKEIYRLEDKDYKLRKKIAKEIKNNDFYDPFTASLYLYKIIKQKKEGKLKIFYDGKGYIVPFKVLKKEKIKVDGKKYKTTKIYLHPNFKTKGLLKPTGDWFIWIDDKIGIPVKMKLTFTIGSFNLYLNKLDGE